MHKRFAIVCPGQGSQSIGMLSALATESPTVRETFEQASDILQYDLWQRIQEGPVEQLNMTWCTQPALLTATVAIWRIWSQRYPAAAPTVMAGHSLGEYSALVCAGAIAFEEAVHLVEQRGRFMAAAVPPGKGKMVAVLGLTECDVRELCHAASQGEVVIPANLNAPEQIVISGTHAAVDRAVQLCTAAGAKRVVPLPVSVPSHCGLMQPAAEQMEKILKKVTIQPPQYPIINNVDVRSETEPEAIRAALVRQLYSPVRWYETMLQMAQQGIEYIFELGPGNVLSGLAKRTVSHITATAIHDPITINSPIEMLKVVQ